MKRHRKIACRTRLLGAVAALLCAAGSAGASEVITVRAGDHPKFTRVVFELDEATGYRVERVGTDERPVLRVTVDAITRSYQLRPTGDVRGVKVAAGRQAVAEIELSKPGLRLQEMILSKPYRIVLDVMKPETALAAAKPPRSAPTRAKKAEPAPAPKAAATPEPKAEPPQVARTAPPPAPSPKVAPKPAEPPPAVEKPAQAKAPAPAVQKPQAEAKAPTPEVKRPTEATAPAPEAKPLAKAPTPEAKPPVAEKPAPAVKPVIADAKPKAPAVEPKPAATPAPPVKPEPSKAVARAQQPEPAPKPAEAETRPAEAKIQTAKAEPADAGAKPAPEAQAKTPPARPTPAPAPAIRKPAPEPRSALPAAPSSSPKSWVDRLLGEPYWLGGIAAVLLGIVALVVVLAARRRRALPNDLDVTAIAEEVEETRPEASEGFDFGQSEAVSSGSESPSASEESPFAGLFDDAPASGETEPATERVAPSAPPPASGSLFDEAGDEPGADTPHGDVPMNQDLDLPADPNRTMPRMGGSAAYGGGAAGGDANPDVARMLQEFERRMTALEAKLDEANEAREKLERQVAAQSEELRVQRAAIARTQRALRTMSRGDEDKATEPALREGDTQAKTRVNV